MQRLFSVLFIFLLFSCNGDSTNNGKEDIYEKSKLSMLEFEKSASVQFLSATIKSKKNILGQRVVSGKISSSAKMVTFKDINLTFRFYSKTGTLLEEDKETIYDSVPPGKTISFKTKYFAPKQTDSVAVEITGAKS